MIKFNYNTLNIVLINILLILIKHFIKIKMLFYYQFICYQCNVVSYHVNFFTLPGTA